MRSKTNGRRVEVSTKEKTNMNSQSYADNVERLKKLHRDVRRNQETIYGLSDVIVLGKGKSRLAVIVLNGAIHKVTRLGRIGQPVGYRSIAGYGFISWQDFHPYTHVICAVAYGMYDGKNPLTHQVGHLAGKGNNAPWALEVVPIHLNKGELEFRRTCRHYGIVCPTIYNHEQINWLMVQSGGEHEKLQELINNNLEGCDVADERIIWQQNRGRYIHQTLTEQLDAVLNGQ